MYRFAREQAQLSREEAAYRLHIGTRTLANYESLLSVPPADVVCAMAELYKSPYLTEYRCITQCSIGKKYCYVPLNNVDSSFTGIISSLEEETEEMMQVIKQLKKLTKNKNGKADFTTKELKQLRKLLAEVWDVEHNIEVLKIELNRLYPVYEDIQSHNVKCLNHGYSTVEIKKTALAMPS